MGSNFSFQFDVDIFGIKGSPRRKSRRACLARKLKINIIMILHKLLPLWARKNKQDSEEN